MMNILLEKCNEATINAKDNRGLTAIHLASLAKDGGFVEKLLSEERD
jgi:ankyrin repeat protein